MSGRAVHFLYLFAVLFIFMPAVHAGIQLDATRVIYPEGKKETTLGLKNEASEPRLIQAWVDAGEGNEARPPFIIMPPIFRIDPGKGQSLRISFIGRKGCRVHRRRRFCNCAGGGEIIMQSSA